MTLEAGTRVGKYEVQSLIGEGGMGSVYRALDTELRRPVALKFLPADVASDPKRLERFGREALAASALNHPNIVTVYDIGRTEDGRPFFATELVKGVTLRERMKARGLKLGEVLDIVAQVAGALVEAHGQGIVHRDVKPDNVMLRRDHIVKVLDFGLAKLTGTPSAGVDTEAATRALVATDAGSVMGTVSYMSPEQSRGEEVDARTDVWSLGVVLYEMLTAHLPFRGRSASHTLVAIQDEEPPPLSAYLPDVPDLLQEVVSDALSKDREARLTAKQMLAKLQRLKRRVDAGGHLDHSVAPNASTPSGEVSGGATASQPGATVSGAHATAFAAGNTASGGAAAASTADVGHHTTSAEYVVSQLKSHRRGVAVALLLITLAASGVGYALYRSGYFKRGEPEAKKPPVSPLSAMKFTRLPVLGGQTLGADISPDGKFLVRYVMEGGKRSLRLRQLKGTTEKEIVSLADALGISGSAFSPDGGSYYYSSRKKDESVTQLYRVSVLGGDAERIGSDVEGPLSFSPDGKRIAFLRRRQDENSIVVMNADGGGEETLLTRKPPLFVTDLAWSPDGRVIAYALFGTDADGYFGNVEALNVADRTTSVVSNARWRTLVGMAWLADGSGLVMCAKDRPSLPGMPTQLWFVAYPNGEAYKITNDLNYYEGILRTADSRTVVVGQSILTSHIWVSPGGDAERARQITSGGVNGYGGFSWTPEGRIVYDSDAGGNIEIWSANADGSGAKQLTFDPNADGDPAASPDGRFVAFLTNRSVGWSLWRMNSDGGGDPRELVRNIYQYAHPEVSPDSRWVFYVSLDGAGKPALWKVSAEGGEPVKVLEKNVASPSVSPDGRQLATFHRDPEPHSPLKILIFPAEGGEPIRTLDTPPGTRDIKLRWSPDGQAVDVIVTREEVSNLWRLPLAGGKARQLTDWKADLIHWFAWSRDGKQLAVSRGNLGLDLVLIENFR